ncbi:MAG: hypothetical protein KBC72_00590 [Acinetobacter sp.]|nr:hypothetical protein [Acinetobacter sp.]
MPNPWELVQSQLKKISKGPRLPLDRPDLWELADYVGFDAYGDKPQVPKELEGMDPTAIEDHVSAPSPSPINSAFRTDEHNREVGGVENSLHKEGLALDIPPKPAPSYIKHMKSRGWTDLDEGDHVHLQKKLPKKLYKFDPTNPEDAELADYVGFQYEKPQPKLPAFVDPNVPRTDVPRETPEMRKMTMEEMAAPSQEFGNSPIGQLYKKAEPALNYNLLQPAQDLLKKLPKPLQRPAAALGGPLTSLPMELEHGKELVNQLGSTMPKTAAIVGGVLDSTDQAINSLFTPVNIGAAVLGAGVPSLQKPMSTGFGVMMGEGAVESGKQLAEAPDLRSKTKALLDMVMMGAGSGAALKHGLGGTPQIPTGLEAPLINKLSVDLEKINAKEAMGKKIIKAEPQVSEVPSIENFDTSGAINQEMPTKAVPMPESPLTLGKQIDSLVKGDSPAVLVTPGSTRPITPKGMRTVDTDVGTFIYDPKKISPNVIRNQVAAGEHGKILGHVEPKSDLTTVAVQAKEGPIEIKTSIVQPDNVAAQKKSLKKQYPDAEIEVKPLEEKLPELIEQRQQPVMGKTKGEHLDYLRSLIEQADAGKRQGHVDEFGNHVNTSYKSSFPIKDLGSKKSQLKIIEKVKSGKVLTDNQQQIYSMMEDFVKKSRTAEAKKYLLKRKEPVEMATGDLALKEGDKVKIPGDTLKVIESTDEKLVLKDGKEITLDPVFDSLEVVGGKRGILRNIKEPEMQPTLLDQVKVAEKQNIAGNNWDPETKAKQSKALGYQMSAIQRGIERKPTGKEVQNARKYLESNHVGKIVQVEGMPAMVEKMSFGKTGVRFPNGEFKYVGKDKISSNPISHESVLDHLEKEAKEQLQSRADSYGIKETQPNTVSLKPNSVKVPQENVKVEAPTVAKTETVRQPVQEAPKVQEPVKAKINPETEKLKSRVYERLQEEHPEILTDDVKYNKMTIKDEIGKSVDLLEQDPERAYRIAKGYEEAGEFNPTTTNIAVAEKALADGNHGLYGDLTRKRSLDLTKKGQDIVAEKASVTDNSTAKYVKKLLQSRADNIKLSEFKSMKRKAMGKKMSKAEVVTDAINQEVVKLKEKVSSRKMNIKEAQNFLERLKCR